MPDDPETLVRWDSITRVALGYEIHSWGPVDWDFWAFQTREPETTYWVYVNNIAESDPFNRAVYERFGSPRVPPMKDWADRELCVRAYVVWPEVDMGEPMYITVKRHWWSFSGRLAYARPG